MSACYDAEGGGAAESEQGRRPAGEVLGGGGEAMGDLRGRGGGDGGPAGGQRKRRGALRGRRRHGGGEGGQLRPGGLDR